MSRFQTQEIRTIKAACPICHSDVRGNEDYSYFCKKCNILYRKEDLVVSGEHVEDVIKKSILKKDMPKVDEKLKENISEKSKIIIKEIREKKTYIVSLKSKMIHADNCPYGKNIKKENRLILKEISGKYKKCRCLK